MTKGLGGEVVSLNGFPEIKMKIKDRLWVIANLARKLLDNDGAGGRYDALKAGSARRALREELQELKEWKKRRTRRPRRSR